jgi:AmmeMemoRadiSam system protein B
VAGYAFAAVRGFAPDLVAVLSPFHQYHHAPLLITAHSGYMTPLGPVLIDGGGGALEQQSPEAGGSAITRTRMTRAFTGDHAFLQRALTSSGSCW